MQHVAYKKNHPQKNLAHLYPTTQEGVIYLSNHDLEVLDKITKLLFSVTKTLFLLLFLPELLGKNILYALHEVISSENLFLLFYRVWFPMAHFKLM